ncbi:MAG: hypothetical protein UW02_C0016G0027 [Candidatus Nomurabacteria bacterium GW2011_GWB1_43_7]|uniref:Zinc-binding domain-containing protein n=3 Tax=Candidatus Nomuraibacteriota TaxID=1752729 RepID=A0A0G1FAB8_9BACT|nr:MAG: hypothetical protein UW02_C0016G0027 [Candidatus Nomurabacteria bacterium GW2011_GWB1_43_7]
MQNETKKCQNCKKDFTIETEDFNFYEKIKVPPPTFCPECRNQRRMSWRGERPLYKRPCSLCEKIIISMYSPNKLLVVYCHDCWWGDTWDPLSAGAEYDFSKPFLQQYSELLKRTPLLALSNLNSVNSEYANFTDNNKGCYLVFASGWNENVLYSRAANWVKDSLDLYCTGKSELMYDCTNCHESYGLRYSQNCKNCTDSFFLLNCRNCSQCFGCINLISKSNCIFNKQYTREEYQKKILEMNCGSWQAREKIRSELAQKFFPSHIYKYANIIGSTDCTGDNIDTSKNCKNCFDIFKNSKNAKYLFTVAELEDVYDSLGQYKNNFSYENVDNDVGNSNNFTVTVYASNNIQYSWNCHGSSNLLGCYGLRQKHYCILNRQYTKEQYEKLVPRIIQHMNDMPYIDKKGRTYRYGEFFPPELSPFCYNETIAQEYFPLTKEEALKQGYKWKDKEERNYQIDIKNEDIPDNIKDVKDEIINKVIECEHQGICNEQCTEAFKIIESELQFYRRMNLPLPHLCPNCRHYQRLKQRNPLKLWHRSCMKPGCDNEFETSYAPDRPEIVYCEKCYQQEVY